MPTISRRLLRGTEIRRAPDKDGGHGGGSKSRKFPLQYVEPMSREYPEHHVALQRRWKLFKDTSATSSKPRGRTETHKQYLARRLKLRGLIRGQMEIFEEGMGLKWLKERRGLLLEQLETGHIKDETDIQRRIREITAFLESLEKK